MGTCLTSLDAPENAHTFLQAWLTAQRMNHTQTPTSLGAGSTTQNLREPENTLSGKPRISTFARGGIVFPNPAVAFFYQSGMFGHRGARMSQFAIAPRGIAYWPRAALPMLPSAPPVAELG